MLTVVIAYELECLRRLGWLGARLLRAMKARLANARQDDWLAKSGKVMALTPLVTTILWTHR